ncbi:hypothetical protein DPX16_8297 [Anabarilius grahami]|uniref:Uncharacterized protein n=1 Tax=Anabarilius grahami TaxID=495550 RepID=A0A3N0YH87_ANAGA|nr:hypothetical protein DPX16_8297 [Anabarilius grahami]
MGLTTVLAAGLLKHSILCHREGKERELDGERDGEEKDKHRLRGHRFDELTMNIRVPTGSVSVSFKPSSCFYLFILHSLVSAVDFNGLQTVERQNYSFSASSKGFKRYQTRNKGLFGPPVVKIEFQEAGSARCLFSKKLISTERKEGMERGNVMNRVFQQTTETWGLEDRGQLQHTLPHPFLFSLSVYLSFFHSFFLSS